MPTGVFSPGERVEHHGWGLVPAADGGRLTVLFDEYGYWELVAEVVSGSYLPESAGDD